MMDSTSPPWCLSNGLLLDLSSAMRFDDGGLIRNACMSDNQTLYVGRVFNADRGINGNPRTPRTRHHGLSHRCR